MIAPSKGKCSHDILRTAVADNEAAWCFNICLNFAVWVQPGHIRQTETDTKCNNKYTDDLCRILDCEIWDVIEYIPDTKKD